MNKTPHAKSIGQTVVGQWIKGRLHHMMKDMADKYSGRFRNVVLKEGRERSNLIKQSKSFRKTLETSTQGKVLDDMPMPSCLLTSNLSLSQSAPSSLAPTDITTLLNIKLFPQPLLLFLSEFINRLHLNDWRIAAMLPALQNLLGSIPIILEPPYEAMLEPGQTLDAPTKAVLRITALQISLEETIGKAIAQSSFWSDSEKASLEDLLNYPMAEDASNYLNLSLFGPFEEHVLGVIMAIGLLTQQLTLCVKKVNFQRYAGTQSTTDALYTPASPCQNVTKIFETVGRIVAGRRMGVAENAFKAVTMPVFVEMVDDAWERSASFLSLTPEQQTFVNLLYLPYSKQQTLDSENQEKDANVALAGATLISDPIVAESKVMKDSVDPSFGKYAKYWRTIFDYASGKVQIPPPGSLTSYTQAICPGEESVECDEFVGAASAFPIDTFYADELFAIVSTNLKPLLDSYGKYPQMADVFVDVLRRKDVSWLARMVIGGVEDAKNYWNDSVAGFCRIVIAESQGNVPDDNATQGNSTPNLSSRTRLK